MKTITLTQGKVALVDDDDFEWLSQKTWNYLVNGYARSGTCELMHRLIAKTPPGMDTDHINGNKLDNRKENLRVCSRSKNSANSTTSRRNKSGLRGVCWSKQARKWDVRIKVGGKQVFLGQYSDLEEARVIHRNAHIKYFGSYSIFARPQGEL